MSASFQKQNQCLLRFVLHRGPAWCLVPWTKVINNAKHWLGFLWKDSLISSSFHLFIIVSLGCFESFANLIWFLCNITPEAWLIYCQVFSQRIPASQFFGENLRIFLRLCLFNNIISGNCYRDISYPVATIVRFPSTDCLIWKWPHLWRKDF